MQGSASRHAADWGFLYSREPPATASIPHARATVKYHGHGHYSLLQKKIPLVGRDAEKAAAQQEVRSGRDILFLTHYYSY